MSQTRQERRRAERAAKKNEEQFKWTIIEAYFLQTLTKSMTSNGQIVRKRTKHRKKALLLDSIIWPILQSRSVHLHLNHFIVQDVPCGPCMG